MDPRLAITRISCSRLLLATSVHLPPLSTDHQVLRASQRCPCVSRHFSCLPSSQETIFTSEEFVAGPIAFAPSCGPPRLQMRSTCGPVWSPQISMFTEWALEAARNSRRSVHGANLPRSTRSCQGESAFSRSQCHRSRGRPAPDRGHRERPSILGRASKSPSLR